MKRIKTGGLNVLLLFTQMYQANSTRPPKVLKRVQSYLVLHLRTIKLLATNKQNARAQSRSSRHGNNYCPDLLKIKNISYAEKSAKPPFARLTKLLSEKLELQLARNTLLSQDLHLQFHKFVELLIRGDCRYLNSFVLSVCFSFCLKLHSRTEKTRQAQGKQHPQRFKSTSRIHAHKKQGTASAKDRSLFRVTFQRLTLCARRNGGK